MQRKVDHDASTVTEYKSLVEKKVDMEQKIASLREFKTSAHDDMKAKKTQYERELESGKKEIERLQEEMEQLKAAHVKEIRGLKSQIENLANEIRENSVSPSLKTELDEALAQKTQLEKSNQENEEKCKNLSSQLESSELRFRQVTESMTVATSMLCEIRNENREIKEKFAEEKRKRRETELQNLRTSSIPIKRE